MKKLIAITIAKNSAIVNCLLALEDASHYLAHAILKANVIEKAIKLVKFMSNNEVSETMTLTHAIVQRPIPSALNAESVRLVHRYESNSNPDGF